ncbi:MAG: cytochrome c3 family protein [Pyrinomonadaceae bacterium]
MPTDSPDTAHADSANHCLTPHAAAPRRVPILLRRYLSIAVLLAASCLLVALALNNRVRAVATATTAPTSPALVQSADMDFSRFSHTSARHASLQCASCHRRADNSPQPTFPGHKSCTACHLAQFVSTNPTSNAMCAICHSNLGERNPPLKGFPKLQSFNALFDHAQHNQGEARPQAGCAACHAPLRRGGAALAIPSGLAAHSQCYTCHTPNASANGRDIGSCNTCHEQGRLVRASMNARAFAASFSHADHSARQRLGCADCHRTRSGVPQLQQVTATITAQHFANSRAQSCLTCHNGRRAFGDANFNDCRKCHKSQSFQMGR